MKKLDRINVLYNGNVHGVGFRFTVVKEAMRVGVTGYVRNLANGSVEAVCEGERTKLEDFLSAIREKMYGYISDSRVDWKTAEGNFKSFEIKF